MADGASQAPAPLVGVVVIGRNEGARLRTCLESLRPHLPYVVYVDSGSRDGSCALAQQMGAHVLALDASIPFTAARARNAGFARLLQLARSLRYIQFVDADCELVPGWLGDGASFLDMHPQVAIVCGRRRERYPDRSVYNLLCDMEWDRPAGATPECGGDCLARVTAFQATGGYRSELIAGEEPELCVRLRGSGWRIWRLDRGMTLHDAAMFNFGQWWRRTLRGGYGYAYAVKLHGRGADRHGVRESLGIWVWGLGVPLAILACVLAWGPWSFGLALLYPAQVMRIAVRGKRARRENWLYAVFVMIGKFAEVLGQLKFMGERYLGGRPKLIEYK